MNLALHGRNAHYHYEHMLIIPQLRRNCKHENEPEGEADGEVGEDLAQHPERRLRVEGGVHGSS